MSEHISYLLRVSLLFIAIVTSVSAYSQNDVSIFGVVRTHEENKKLSGVTITIFQDGTKYSTEKSNANGKYEFVINFDHEYKIVYTYPLYVSKHLTIDTRAVPEDAKETGYEMNIDMTLFHEIEGLDVSILDNPIGKAQFYSADGLMGWDMAYTKKMQAEIQSLMREHDRKLKEEEDRMAKLKQEFEDLVRKGDEAVRNKKHADAIDLYADALILFPDDEGVQTKKANAEEALAGILALKEKEKKYNGFINTGDQKFGSKEYENALSAYRSASDIFPDETYPKQRITEINEKLDAIRANAANETLVASLIKEGDKMVDQDKYDDGISKYTEALSLIPGHDIATQQLEEAKKKKAEWLVNQEKEVNYSNLIADANEQFETNDFRKCIATYQAALEIKPDESYPKDQIAKAEGFIAKASAEMEKKQEFDELVSQGDAKVNVQAYQEGIDKYKAALVIYPDNGEVKAKIADAENAISSLLAAGELEERYKNIIAKADKSLGNKDYEDAKSNYEQALAIKENEKYPKDKIAEINTILAGLAEADLAKAEAAKRESFDKLVAEGDQKAIEADYDNAINKFEAALAIIPGVKEVEDKIANAKQRRSDLMANKAVDAQYDELIARGDREFNIKAYERSKESFQGALDLKDEDYPKQKIAEIDLLLLELAKAGEQEELMAEFEKLEKEGDVSIEKNDFANGISSYETALSLIPGVQRVIDKKALAEKELAALNADLANIEQYNNFIASADLAFGEKKYSNSRRLYQKAFAIKPDEYPKNKIIEIDRLLLALERKAAEEEAAKLAAVKNEREWNSNTSDEEKYIKQANEDRNRSEDDKYAEVLAYKEALRKSEQSNAEKGDRLRNENASVIASEQQNKVDDFRAGEEYHAAMLNETENAQAEHMQWQKELSEKNLTASRNTYNDLVEMNSKMQEQHRYKNDRYKDNYKEIKANKESYQNFNYSKSADHNDQIRKNYYQSQEKAADQYRSFSDKDNLRKANMTQVDYDKEDMVQFENRNGQAQQDRVENARDENANLKENVAKQGEKDMEEVKKSYNDLNNENEMRDVETDRWKARADVKREQAADEVRDTDYSGKKDYNDYNSGGLSSQYQQGVTEETYEEGNKKIIKRVVVKGNKADEYKMVVMKSGIYYFKNGYSITKNTWNSETEVKARSMD